MEPDELQEDIERLGAHIDALIERSEQQALDIKKAKRELSKIEPSISPEQQENKRSGEA